MPLLQILVVLIVVGVLLWLVNQFIPMAGSIKSILNAVAASSTAGIGSASSTRGQNTGQAIGTTAMTSTWTTTATDIICTTADIPAIALPSVST